MTLKLIKNLFFLGILSFFQIIIPNPKFKEPAEKELFDAIKYYKEPGETDEQVKKDILSGSKLLHHKDKISYLPDLADFYAQQGLTDVQNNILDLQKTFDRLKVMMKIPQEVNAMYCHDQISEGIMSYDPLDRTMYLYPRIHDHCRSFHLFTLIHELTHAQQHMRLGLMGYRLRDNRDNECEADTQAAQAVKCSVCMKAILADQLLHEAAASADNIAMCAKRGYLIAKDLKKHQKQKSVNDLCNVHKSYSDHNKSFLSTLKSWFSTPLKQIFESDYSTGLRSDRLSTVRFE